MTLSNWLKQATKKLDGISESPRLDVELLVCQVLSQTRAFIYAHPEIKLKSSEVKTLKLYINQRAKGLPIAYITGIKEFWSLPFKINQHTLCPRPETELLVEKSLHALTDCPQPTIIDLGTGCGAIAIALATERPDAKVFAVDISTKALAIAKQNIEQFQLRNVTLIKSDWFDSLPSLTADLIISNPPYIAKDCPHIEEAVLKFEPSLALFSRNNGLYDINKIAASTTRFLKQEGLLMLEFGFNQQVEVEKLLKKYGYNQIKCVYLSTILLSTNQN